MKLSIILPVYNEAANINEVIATIEKEVKIPHQIIIVYDFDKDNTLPLLRQWQKKSTNLCLVKNNQGNKKGVINAIKTGFKTVKDGAIVVTMADLSDEPKTINRMFKKITQGYDVVCASRYSLGGRKIGGPALKSLLSKWSGLLTPYLLGIPTQDVTNAFKMYTKKVLETIKIESSGGFELSMEIVIKAHQQGFKITEVPTAWRDRTTGKSRFKMLAWLPSYLHWYVWGIANNFRLLLFPGRGNS